MSSNKKENDTATNTTLLITGAINIESHLPFKTKLTKTEERLRQYLQSIIYAIEHYECITNIVFCENTGYDFNYEEIYQIAKKKHKNLEILSFKGDKQLLIQKGKGYGEGEIINYCLKESVLLKNSDSFIKLTGRLCVTNFDKLFNNNPGKNIFMLDNVAFKNVDLQISTILYKVNIVFYQAYLKDCHLIVDDEKGFYIEHSFGKSIIKDNLENFEYLPNIEGMTGSSGDQYKNSIRKTIYFHLGLLNVNQNVLSKIINNIYNSLKNIILFVRKNNKQE